MNEATGSIVAPCALKEDAGSIMLTQKKAIAPGPPGFNILLQKFHPTEPQAISNASCFYQTHPNMISSTTDTTPEAQNW